MPQIDLIVLCHTGTARTCISESTSPWLYVMVVVVVTFMILVTLLAVIIIIVVVCWKYSHLKSLPKNGEYVTHQILALSCYIHTHTHIYIYIAVHFLGIGICIIKSNSWRDVIPRNVIINLSIISSMWQWNEGYCSIWYYWWCPDITWWRGSDAQESCIFYCCHSNDRNIRRECLDMNLMVSKLVLHLSCICYVSHVYVDRHNIHTQ